MSKSYSHCQKGFTYVEVAGKKKKKRKKVDSLTAQEKQGTQELSQNIKQLWIIQATTYIKINF